MLNALRLTALTTVLICLVGTSVADARRPATKAEKRGIVKHGPPRCQTVFISTVNPRFASSQWNEKGRDCLRYASNGIGIFEKRDGNWTYISGMSECTQAGMARVPHRVYRELTRAFCAGSKRRLRRCAPGHAGVDDLRTNRLKCGSARKVVSRWMDADRCLTKDSCSIRVSGTRWDCHTTRRGRRSDVSCIPYLRPRNVQFVYVGSS